MTKLLARSGGASAEFRVNFEDATVQFTDGAVQQWFDQRDGYVGGRAVTPQTAITGTGAVYASSSLLAKTVGLLPLHTFKRVDDEKRERILTDTKDGNLAGTGYPGSLARIVGELPNPKQTAQQFWEYHVMSQCGWGNAYSYVERDAAGRPAALWPLLPEYLQEKWKDGRLYYIYRPASGGWTGAATFSEEEVWVDSWVTLDGRTGVSPITVLRNAVGTSQAMQQFGANWFEQGATPSLIVQIPKQPNAQLFSDRADVMQKQFQSKWGGAANAGRIGVVEENMNVTPLTMPLQDMQFVEQQRFTIEEVARVYGIPPWMIGETMKSTAWGTGLEQLKRAFLDFTIVPITTRIQNGINRDLGLVPGQRTLMDEQIYVEFQTAAFLQADSKTQADTNAVLLQNRIVTPRYVAAKMNLPFDEDRPDDYENPNTTSGAPDAPVDEEKVSELIAAYAQGRGDVNVSIPLPEGVKLDIPTPKVTTHVSTDNVARALVEQQKENRAMFGHIAELIEATRPKAMVRTIERDEHGNMTTIRESFEESA